MLLLVLSFETEADREKFEAVYAKYKNLMLHKAFQVLRDPMLAEDAVSEAMIRIYKNLNKIDRPDSPRCAAFVATIARNTALTLLSRQKRQPSEPVEDYDTTDGYDLEEHVLAALSSERIHAIVERLGDELRSVFVLKYAYDMPHREIGKVLKITENNVTVRLHRARKKLCKLLAEEEFAHEQAGP